MKKCPLLNKKCVENKCMFWTHLIGKNPQTDQDVDDFNCAIAFLPILLIENAGSVRRNQAAIESLRNETVKRQDEFLDEVREAKAKKLRELNNTNLIDVPKL